MSFVASLLCYGSSIKGDIRYNSTRRVVQDVIVIQDVDSKLGEDFAKSDFWDTDLRIEKWTLMTCRILLCKFLTFLSCFSVLMLVTFSRT